MEVPKVLDNKYENLEQLGEGAFGVVYKARSLESNRLYAIKYAKDDDAVKALAKEENLETRLNHQNIVKVYEANLRNSLPYIVMGYIEGESLEERLGKGTISQNESLMIVKQVLNALSYAHSQNVVHGDIKPSNILISRDGTVKVTDFGIGKILEKMDYGKKRSYGAIGTRAYSSPEQRFGSETSFPTDIFSLGMVWYEMLTGGLPKLYWDGEPKLFFPKVINEIQIPKTIGRILSRSLIIDDRRRYKNAVEMHSVLERALEVKTPKIPQLYATVRKNSRVAVAYAVGILALSIGELALNEFIEKPERVTIKL